MKSPVMEQADVIAIIQQELPRLIAQEPLVRDFVLRTVSDFYMGKQEADRRFDSILAELQRDREQQARKWDEGRATFLVVELLSLGTEAEDLERKLREVQQPPTKWEVYEQILRIPYYSDFQVSKPRRNTKQ